MYRYIEWAMGEDDEVPVLEAVSMHCQDLFYLVWKHDDGFFLLLAIVRSFLFLFFVAVPKVYIGNGAEIGKSKAKGYFFYFFYCDIFLLHFVHTPSIIHLQSYIIIRTLSLYRVFALREHLRGEAAETLIIWGNKCSRGQMTFGSSCGTNC